jgi:hypothetical protein
LHEERRLEFEVAFARPGGLGHGDYAEHGGGSQFPRPMKRVHGLMIATRASVGMMTSDGCLPLYCFARSICFGQGEVES